MIILSDDKKEDNENPYPVNNDGKVYITKSADKHKKLENKNLNK